MLPGFRFLFAAILLSMSMLVFGLGAAAVLRAAHEQFAESGSWRPAPDTSVAQPSEPTKPVLAMLRVDPPSAAPNAIDAVTPPVQPGEGASSPEPERTAALDPQAGPLSDAAKADAPEVGKAELAPDAPKVEDKETQGTVVAAVPASQEPAHQDVPAAQPTPAVEVPAAADTRAAAADPAPPVAPSSPAAPAISSPPAVDAPAFISTSEAFPAAPEQPGAPVAAGPARARIATLGGPPVVIEEPANAVRTSLDPSEVKKEREKERTEERARRRRLAARRARLAQQAALAEQAANPFAQINPGPPFVPPLLQPGATARTR